MSGIADEPRADDDGLVNVRPLVDPDGDQVGGFVDFGGAVTTVVSDENPSPVGTFLVDPKTGSITDISRYVADGPR